MPRKRQAPDAEADPLIPPAAFAKLLGHTDTTTVMKWAKEEQTLPPGWPAPDEWIELPTRLRPMWRLSAATAFAAVERSPGVGPGEFHGERHVHQAVADPRSVEIAEWLAEADSGKRAPVTRQQIEAHFEVPDYTARHLLARARAHREEQS